MANSQNGWSVITSGSSKELKTLPHITGKVRAGDVFTIFTWLADRFNAEVESITKSSSWGWANRNISGSTSISNHASGTAVDFNAPAHPLGKSGTFSAAQVSAIQAILALANSRGNILRWGGNYSGRKDEMHFEIIGNAAQAATSAAFLSGQSSGGTSSTGRNADGSLTLAVDGVRGAATNARAAEVFGTTVTGHGVKPKADQIAAEQKFLNDIINDTQMKDLVGAATLAEDGIEGPKTIIARNFYLFNHFAPSVLGRQAATSDFGKVFTKQGVRLFQTALNAATAGSKRY